MNSRIRLIKLAERNRVQMVQDSANNNNKNGSLNILNMAPLPYSMKNMHTDYRLCYSRYIITRPRSAHHEPAAEWGAIEDETQEQTTVIKPNQKPLTDLEREALG
jgi:hypothetical protein